MAKVTSTVHWVEIGSIASMFDFHACILADIDIVLPGFVFLKVVGNSHVHIKSLVSLLLTVLNAFYFSLVLWGSEIKVYTVLMALLEKKFWERILSQRIFFVVWITTPVACRCHFFY